MLPSYALLLIICRWKTISSSISSLVWLTVFPYVPLPTSRCNRHCSLKRFWVNHSRHCTLAFLCHIWYLAIDVVTIVPWESFWLCRLMRQYPCIYLSKKKGIGCPSTPNLVNAFEDQLCVSSAILHSKWLLLRGPLLNPCLPLYCVSLLMISTSDKTLEYPHHPVI